MTERKFAIVYPIGEIVEDGNQPTLEIATETKIRDDLSAALIKSGREDTNKKHPIETILHVLTGGADTSLDCDVCGNWTEIKDV